LRLMLIFGYRALLTVSHIIAQNIPRVKKMSYPFHRVMKASASSARDPPPSIQVLRREAGAGFSHLRERPDQRFLKPETTPAA
jgi:hypothetical protein